MANRLNTKTAAVEYLLGNLSPEEADRVEHDFFTDDEKFQELELAEDDLIDAYVRRELSDAEQRQFQEKLLIVPRIAERVDFARVFAERTPAPVQPPRVVPQPEPAVIVQPPPKRRWWASLFEPQLRPALAACFAVVVVGALFLLTGWLTLERRSAELVAERAAVQQQKENLDRQATELQARSEQQTAEVKKQLDQIAADRKLLEERLQQEERSASTIGSVVPFLLTPGVTRDLESEGNNLKLSPNASTVNLKLAVAGGDYRSYNVTVKTVDDEKIVTAQTGRKLQKPRAGAIVAISIPVRKLPPADYLVDVDGVTSSGEVAPVGRYSFRVSKKPK